jgi:hypothetical protein
MEFEANKQPIHMEFEVKALEQVEGVKKEFVSLSKEILSYSKVPFLCTGDKCQGICKKSWLTSS